jgi:N-acetylmuramoyl-L-alanine amidase CwlA
MPYTIQKYHTGYNRFARNRSNVRYIVVHYVGSGSNATGNALANCKYFAGGNRNASAHYFIDDGSIYECIDPASYGAWHVGDGHGAYGITNTNSIGIEVCNNGGPFTDAEIDRLTWLVQKLMSEYGVDSSRVVRHYDASRKQCPAYYASNYSAWIKLRDQITGGSVSGGSSSSSDSSDLGDTSWTGPLMLSELQRQLGTTVDGKISNQSYYIRHSILWRVCSDCFDGSMTASNGSQMVVALQKKVGADADGFCGPNTVKKLQTFLNNKIGAGLDVDGYYGPATSRAVGTGLVKGVFK